MKARLYQGDWGLPQVNYKVQSSAKLPLTVPAKFSMTLGTFSCLNYLLDEGEALVNHMEVTPWVSAAVDGASFTSAVNIVEGFRKAFSVNQRSVNELASLDVHGVADGGF